MRCSTIRVSQPVAVLGALLVSSGACLAVQPASGVPSDAEIRQILAERIDEQKRSVGIVVGVVEPGGRRVVAHGQLATDDRTDVDGDTVFEIGSITKVFTAVLLADLAGEGAFELEAPVQRLLGPDVTVPTRNDTEITLLHLTTHSSGLPRMPDNLRPADAGNPYADYTVAQLYEFLSSHELQRDIGVEVEYSNLGTGLLGHALALSQETDYGTLVSTRLLDPLGMSDTSITLSPSQQERLAVGHSVQLRPVANWDLPTLAGAGALRSTVNDMLTFVEANLGLHELPLQAAMAETHAPRRDFPGPEHADRSRLGHPWRPRPRTPLAQRWYRRLPLVPRLRPGVADRRRRAFELRRQRRRPGLSPTGAGLPPRPAAGVPDRGGGRSGDLRRLRREVSAHPRTSSSR